MASIGACPMPLAAYVMGLGTGGSGHDSGLLWLLAVVCVWWLLVPAWEGSGPGLMGEPLACVGMATAVRGVT